MKYFYIVLTCIFLTSCFEVIEEIDLHKDGSGEVTYTLNASQSKIKLASIMQMDSLNGQNIPSKNDIERKLMEISDFLKKQKGISSCIFNTDHVEFIYEIKIAFDNIQALDKALKSSPLLEKNKIELKTNLYEATTHRFNKYYYLVDDLNKEKKTIEKYKSDLQQANYTCILRTDRTILSGIGSKTIISGNKKAAMTKYSIYEALQQSNNITFGVTY